MKVSIVSKQGYPKPYVALEIFDGHITLGECVDFAYQLYDADGVSNLGGRCKLTKAQYEAWIGPDIYCIQCVALNLGLVIV